MESVDEFESLISESVLSKESGTLNTNSQTSETLSQEEVIPEEKLASVIGEQANFDDANIDETKDLRGTEHFEDKIIQPGSTLEQNENSEEANSSNKSSQSLILQTPTTESHFSIPLNSENMLTESVETNSNESLGFTLDQAKHKKLEIKTQTESVDLEIKKSHEEKNGEEISLDESIDNAISNFFKTGNLLEKEYSAECKHFLNLLKENGFLEFVTKKDIPNFDLLSKLTKRSKHKRENRAVIQASDMESEDSISNSLRRLETPNNESQGFRNLTPQEISSKKKSRNAAGKEFDIYDNVLCSDFDPVLTSVTLKGFKSSRGDCDEESRLKGKLKKGHSKDGCNAKSKDSHEKVNKCISKADPNKFEKMHPIEQNDSPNLLADNVLNTEKGNFTEAEGNKIVDLKERDCIIEGERQVKSEEIDLCPQNKKQPDEGNDFDKIQLKSSSLQHKYELWGKLSEKLKKIPISSQQIAKNESDSSYMQIQKELQNIVNDKNIGLGDENQMFIGTNLPEDYKKSKTDKTDKIDKGELTTEAQYQSSGEVYDTKPKTDDVQENSRILICDLACKHECAEYLNQIENKTDDTVPNDSVINEGSKFELTEEIDAIVLKEINCIIDEVVEEQLKSEEHIDLSPEDKLFESNDSQTKKERLENVIDKLKALPVSSDNAVSYKSQPSLGKTEIEKNSNEESNCPVSSENKIQYGGKAGLPPDFCFSFPSTKFNSKDFFKNQGLILSSLDESELSNKSNDDLFIVNLHKIPSFNREQLKKEINGIVKEALENPIEEVTEFAESSCNRANKNFTENKGIETTKSINKEEKTSESPVKSSKGSNLEPKIITEMYGETTANFNDVPMFMIAHNLNCHPDPMPSVQNSKIKEWLDESNELNDESQTLTENLSGTENNQISGSVLYSIFTQMKKAPRTSMASKKLSDFDPVRKISSFINKTVLVPSEQETHNYHLHFDLNTGLNENDSIQRSKTNLLKRDSESRKLNQASSETENEPLKRHKPTELSESSHKKSDGLACSEKENESPNKRKQTESPKSPFEKSSHDLSCSETPKESLKKPSLKKPADSPESSCKKQSYNPQIYSMTEIVRDPSQLSRCNEINFYLLRRKTAFAKTKKEKSILRNILMPGNPSKTKYNETCDLNSNNKRKLELLLIHDYEYNGFGELSLEEKRYIHQAKQRKLNSVSSLSKILDCNAMEKIFSYLAEVLRLFLSFLSLLFILFTVFIFAFYKWSKNYLKF